MYTYHSPLGIMTYEIENDQLVSTAFYTDQKPIEREENIKMVNDQLNQYFNRQLKQFNLPIQFNKGTDFQKDVWKAMLEIPYGETRSYEEIAVRIGRPKACRAVGQACKKNPIGLIVPCHRVIGKDGSLRGYSGKSFIGIKEQLLAFERGR